MSSYNISEPSAIKRLKSDGKVVDEPFELYRNSECDMNLS